VRKIILLAFLIPLVSFGQSIVVTNNQSFVQFDTPLVVSNSIDAVLIHSIESPNPADTNAIYKIRIVKDFDDELRSADGSLLQIQTSLHSELSVSIDERIAYINTAVPSANITAENYDQQMTVEYIRQSVVGVAVAKFIDLFELIQP